MNATTREWTIQDLPEVHELLAELCRSIGDPYHGSLELVERHFHECRRLPEMYSNWVCVRDGRVVGYLSAVYYGSALHRKGTALINELVVAAGCRGQGIGRLLLERCVQEARARGFDEVEVGAEKANTRAIEFYRNNGIRREYVLLGKELGPSG